MFLLKCDVYEGAILILAITKLSIAFASVQRSQVLPKRFQRPHYTSTFASDIFQRVSKYFELWRSGSTISATT